MLNKDRRIKNGWSRRDTNFRRSTILDGINYVYLMDENDYSNFMFCAYDQTDGLYEVEDANLLEQLLGIFNEQLANRQEDDE